VEYEAAREGYLAVMDQIDGIRQGSAEQVQDPQRLDALDARLAAVDTSLGQELAAFAAAPAPMNQVDRDLSYVEARVNSRQGDGSWATAEQRQEELARLDQVRQGIRELQEQAAGHPRLASLSGRLTAVEQQLTGEPATPYSRYSVMDRVEEKIRRVEAYQQDASRPQGQGSGWLVERKSLLDAAASDLWQRQEYDPRPAQEEADRRRNLNARLEEQRRWEGYDRLYGVVARERERAERASGQPPTGEGMQMRAVGPEDVAGPPGLTATELDRTNPGLTATELDRTNPGLTATELDKTNPGLTPTELDQRPLTRQRDAGQVTSPRREAAKELAVQAGPVATVGLGGALLTYMLSLHPKLRALGVLVSPEVLKALPGWPASPPPGA
jgi:hypothetical protein